MKLALITLATAMLVFTILQGAHAEAAGQTIGSRTIVYNTPQLNDTFEAKISSNSFFVVPAVLIETYGAGSSVSVREWRTYDPYGGGPTVYKSPEDSLPTVNGKAKALAGSDVLPLGALAGGSVSMVLDVQGMQQGNQVAVTFVYMANVGSTVYAEIPPPIQLPFYVTENSQVESNSTGLRISDSYVNPEIHCEICTVVETEGQIDAAYVTNATDLSSATKFAFWARGQEGSEKVTFKIAGKDDATFVNITSVALGSDWKRYEVDLTGTDLREITHLFGFEAGGAQKFYVKGAAYY